MIKVFVKILLAFFILSLAVFGQASDDVARILKENRDALQRDDNSSYSSEIQGQDKSLDSIETNLSQNEIFEDFGIFGFNYINNIPKSISSTSDLPVPNDYIISLGDKLKIILTGGKKEMLELEVGLDGNILFPDIGSINIFGDSLEEVKEKIEQFIDLSYVGTKVSVSISSLAAKKINIIGAVKMPGTYIVNPFSTVTSALAYSGGFAEYASLREIKIFRKGEELSFDLYDLLIYGKRDADINIQQGDTIFVKSTQKHVTLSGEILRPFVYEYTELDTYADIIEFGMGPSKYSDVRNIFATSLNNGTSIGFSVDLNSKIGDTSLDTMFVGKNKKSEKTGIVVRGNSVRERFFEDGTFKNIHDLIEVLEFSDNIYPFYAKLTQTSENGTFRESINFSLNDARSYDNIQLKENVLIRFFSREEIEGSQILSLKKLGLDSSIELNNELIEDALNLEQTTQNDKTEDEFSDVSDLFGIRDLKIINFGEETYLLPLIGDITPRKIFNYFGKEQSVLLNLVSVNTDAGMEIDVYNNTFRSEEISQINFPSPTSTNFLVSISGQINNPGTFSINSSVTLNEIYEIAGGFTKKADLGSIILKRKSIKLKEKTFVDSAKKTILDSLITQYSNPLNATSGESAESLISIIQLAETLDFQGRLSGDLSPGSTNSSNVTLEPGDEIIVPSISSTISVIGEVLQPITVAYIRDQAAIDYILSAGNFNKYADKNNIYVINPNGISTPVKYRNLSNLVLMPGDTIVIPRDLGKLDTLPLVSTSVKIISDIAFAAASLNILNN